jgi:hypothetical protein
MKGGLVYNNIIDTKQGCLLDNRDSNSSNWLYSCGTHSLRIRTSDGYYRWAGGPVSNPYGENGNNKFYNNTIIAREFDYIPGTNQSYAYAVRVGVKDYNQSLNMTFENNSIQAYKNSGQSAKAVYVDGLVPGNNILFKNNEFLSDDMPLMVSGSDVNFLNNKIVRYGSYSSYIPIMIGYSGYQSTGNLFLNQSFINSSGFLSMRFSPTSDSALRNVTVKWFLDVNATSSGVPANGASVLVNDAFNNQEFSGITDASGFAKMNLTEFKSICNGGECIPLRTNYTPHNVSVTYNSVNQWRIVNMNQSRVEGFVF